ncbi:nuclear transport factor 2 family protein [Kribbella sp. CA-253562]|uniref:nuclear transport factor 2 family protein n=1 Tax=Kribbella sp. CA-253562 TaxID=3239942 RepID=UPI003D906CE1
MELNQVIDRLGRTWTEGPAVMDDLLSDDVVIEVPFAPGGGQRWVGKENWLAYAVPSRAQLPVSFDSFTQHAVHLTAEPEVAVVEYELGGVVATTRGSRSVAAPSTCRAGRDHAGDRRAIGAAVRRGAGHGADGRDRGLRRAWW